MLCCAEKSKSFFLLLFLFLFNICSLFFLPIFLVYLLWRVAKNKEELHRLGERFGFSRSQFKYRDRPTIWLHASSIGESIALFNIIQKLLNDSNYNILVTTGTVTSANLVQDYFSRQIYRGVLVHQYNILDLDWSLALFLKHWNIKLAICCESEIWPFRILKLYNKNISQIIVNATMSQKTFVSWQRIPNIAKFIFNKLNLVLCQNQESKEKYIKLGVARAMVAGNLKAEAKPQIRDKKLFNEVKKILQNQRFVAAISTHKGEEEIILRIYQKLKFHYKDLGLILVPRHIDRCSFIVEKIKQYNFTYACKSTIDKCPNDANNIDIILGNTIGDMGFFLSLSDIAFIGKSIGVDEGGHNPIEAAMMGVPIVSGYKVGNFKQIYNILKQNNAAIIVKNEEELYNNLQNLLTNIDLKNQLVQNAFKAIKNMQGAVEYSYNLLKPYLDRICKC